MTDTAGLAFGLGSVTVALAIALYLWTAIALAAVFRKSGEEPWKAWVPVFNGMTLLWLGGLSGWLFLIVFVPVVGTLAAWVLVVVACHRVNVGFGKGAGMTVLAALLFPVWASVLGFGADRWVGRRPNEGSRALSPVFPGGAATGPGTALRPTGPTRGTYAAPGVARSRAQDEAPDPTEPSWVRPAPPLPTSVVDPEIIGSRPAATRSQNPIPPVPRATAAEAAQVHGPWQPASAAPSPGGSSMPPAPSATPASRPAPGEGPVPASPSSADEAPPRSAVARPGTPPAEGVYRTIDPENRPARTDPVEAGAGLRRSSARSAPAPGSDEDLWAMFDYEPSLGATGEVTGGVAGAPGPISAIPGAEAASPAPAAAVPPVTRVPSAPAVPLRDPWAPSSDRDVFGESGEVSAIAGAPDAGAPRAARSSVSAQHPRAELPEEPIDETIVARRRRTTWTLQMPAGRSVPLTSDVVILGRRPSSDPDFPDAQLIPVDEPTVSKTHARLELRDEEWVVTDLQSTNGVVLVTETGAEIDVVPGVESIAGSRIVLGDAELKLVRTDA